MDLTVRLLRPAALIAIAFAMTGCSLGWLFKVQHPENAAVLTNAPISYSSLSQLSIGVTGDLVTSYRYKLGPSTTTNCASDSGYSARSYPAGTPISDDMTPYAEQTVTLCVVGTNTKGVQQSYSNASVVSWYVDLNPAYYAIVEGEQSVQETDSSTKTITITSSIMKPYPVTVTYALTGDATPGIDTNLPASGTVVMPAGATSVAIPFRVFANAATTAKQIILTLKSTDNANALPALTAKSSTVIIYDTDAGVRPTVQSYALSLGGSTACAILTNGVLKCWGDNSDGQIGDGTTTSRSTPVVVNSGVSYSSVAVGLNTTCGITTAGVLKCWGNNAYSQLGNGTTTSSSTPVVVDSGVTYSSVSLGTYVGTTVCAITTAGILNCWGYNNFGQIGDNTVVTKTAPTAIGGTARFQSVSVGFNTTCAITTVAQSSALYCWGNGTVGQLGDGTIVSKRVPTLIDTGVTYASVKTIASNTCALTTGGALKCWGANTNGQVGNGTTTTTSSPATIDAGTNYALYSLSGTDTCGITTTGALRCWGNNGSGQIGDGTTTNRSSPVTIDSGVTYARVSVHGSSVCATAAVTSGSVLKCWGNNSARQLGDGTIVNKNTPTLIDSGVGYSSIQVVSENSRSGTSLTCGTTTTGQMKCWGMNHIGQIGDGSSISRTAPVVIDSGTSYTKVDFGGYSACGLTDTGRIKCWGRNNYGQGGNGATVNSTVPTAVSDTTTYQNVIAAGNVNYGLTTAGKIKAWGQNNYGQVGNGTTTNQTTPVAVDADTTYTKVSMSDSSACGITSTGALKCWGLNTSGQLGLGTLTNVLSPTLVDSGTSYSFVSTGGQTTCGITTAKLLKCWGLNSYGQIGTGDLINTTSPIVIDGSNTYKYVSTQGFTTCAITDVGVLKCWGLNNYGQVGNGGTTNILSPTIVNAGTSYSSVTTTSLYVTCGITSTGAAQCWGNNSSGQIGNGTYTTTTSPYTINAGTNYSWVSSYFASCALSSVGAINCWGSNMYGGIGDGTSVTRLSPVAIDTGTTYRFLSIVAADTSCAITSTGILKCWGRNDEGQVGDGTDLYRPIPRNITKWLTP